MSRVLLSISISAVVVLAVTPVLLYDGDPVSSSALKVIIVSPHNEQIRFEFSKAFANWHEKNYGKRVDIAWNTPGGTTEIRRMLTAQYESALKHNLPVGGDADLIFGGGSYEFQTLARPISFGSGEQERKTTILETCTWMTTDQLNEIYGANDIAGNPLYDKNLHWFGVALSTFGIVCNRAQCDALHIEPPKLWQDLADPRLFESIALVNPSQSGSVATAFETILQRLGWVRGWQVMRRAAGNSNQIIASSSVIPTTVGDGESLAGIAIDFYGRYQVQALSDAATKTHNPSLDRLQFITPAGQSVIDPDPVAILRGAPNLELAKHFVLFCLSMEGQLLWQLPHGDGELCGYPQPEQYSLRRMPARRAAYACCQTCFVDQVDPFNEPPSAPANPNFRDFVSPLFVPMAIGNTELLREAWHAIITHPSYPKSTSIVSASDITDPTLKSWIEAFDALPTVAGPDGAIFKLDDPQSLAAVRKGWLKRGFEGSGLWGEREDPRTLLRRQFSAFFEKQYLMIIESSRTGNPLRAG